ncbi:sugar ABC transporter substrate-binding protein [Candidatus Aerophobetes bacterium]|nr:sugar ABC transporter substrate-binding protein [Candidatus Aerophobetes bacterium]
MKTNRIFLVIEFLLVLIIAFTTGSQGKQYEGVIIRVLSQPHNEMVVAEKYLPEFEAKTGMKVEIINFGEQDRRAKSRLDASTRAGSYQVYYLDEANVAEFAAAGWVLPLLDYYPDEYDFHDFFDSFADIGSYKGVPYFAPTTGGGDFFMYRKDILQEKGIAVPKTLEELEIAIKKIHNPPEIYGWVARGKRGSGMNVWRWAPFFRGFGGNWVDENGEPAINSGAAVRATKKYIELMKYGPPGITTSDWSDNIEAFRAGKVAFIIETNMFADWMEDPEKSAVVGKVGYAPPPRPLISAGYAHGLGISAAGCKNEKLREAAGLFIAWVTSKDQEVKRLEEGYFNSYARKSTLEHPLFKEKVKPEIRQAIVEMDPFTELPIWPIPEWPEIGDRLGVILEELFTGVRTDIREALNEANEYAKEVLARRRE